MKEIIFLAFLISSIFSIQNEYIKYEEDGMISIITINRPKALNALNSKVLEELDKTLDSIDTSKIRAIIITGEGEKSFVAGADIAEMSSLSKKQAQEFSKKGNDVFRKIETFPIPVIAAVNGFALGGGCEISMSCDIRICSDNAIFGQPEVGLGITPGFGGTQRLARLVGMGMAKQMIYTGQNIKAQEALRIGLVNAVYPQKELLNEAKKLAKIISQNGPNAIKNSKKAINEGIEVEMGEAITIEEKLFGECFETSEQIEGMKNFLNKGKKGGKSSDKPKNLKQENKSPRGELVPTNKFNNMGYLKEFSTSALPGILTAGDKNGYNSMLIEWGSLGVAWRRPIFTVYVKPERYTHDFLEKYPIFTVSIFSKEFKKKMSIYGVTSGRDTNKEEKAGTHIQFLDDGGITFEEAEEVFVCKIVARAYVKDGELDPEIIEMFKSNLKLYTSTSAHTLFVGQIIGHYKRKN